MRMKCPICEDVRMREVIKDGVTIDVCPDCKGVWLDRGELDKLMQGVNAMRQELDEYENAQASFNQPSAAATPMPPVQQQRTAPPPVQPAQPYTQAQPAPGYGQQYQQQPGVYGTPQQPVYGNPPPGQQGHYGNMPPQGGYGYGSGHKYDKYGSKHGYDKYGRPYKKHKTVLDVFGDLFD
jgi:uncharacterized protein